MFTAPNTARPSVLATVWIATGSPQGARRRDGPREMRMKVEKPWQKVEKPQQNMEKHQQNMEKSDCGMRFFRVFPGKKSDFRRSKNMLFKQIKYLMQEHSILSIFVAGLEHAPGAKRGHWGRVPTREAGAPERRRLPVVTAPPRVLSRAALVGAPTSH